MKNPQYVHARHRGTVAYANTNYILLGMIIEKLTGHSLASELKKRIFTPLGMRDTYLPVKGSEGIKGPHGHGYTVNEKGAVVDVDKMNATAQLGAGGVISTAHDMSAFKRAFTQNKLVPASLTTVITTIPGVPPITGGGPCKGNPEFGPRNDDGAPGYVSTTFASSDGRIQFAVSMTLAMNDDERLGAGRPLGDALTSVFCPAA
ncbi:serine hydrolase domain-containing protein [Nonomuraea jabiensis]|uniref:serine hydrolase domain-containing protein n=1 Tax=Nonomuraea jabiensis TaxID=882448 RepID=UPI0036BA4245